jgi:septal ring factor EnvC (AmiA/AmiB activator)
MSPVTKKLNGAARAATDWIGSVQSLVVHTALFAVSFSLAFFGVGFEQILLVVTTIVSLEAIYLAIFIQMAINQQSQSLEEVEKDVDEIQDKVEEIHEDVEGIQEDVEDIQEDVEDIQEDIDEIEKDDSEEETRDRQNKQVLDKIEASLGSLITEIEKMKKDLR